MLDVKKTLAKLLNSVIIIKTYTGTYDRLSPDGWAGYIDNTTLGIDVLTKYHWFIQNQQNWQQRTVMQDVSSSTITFRTWVISSTANASVTLLRNANPSPFTIIGIRKMGG